MSGQIINIACAVGTLIKKGVIGFFWVVIFLSALFPVDTFIK